MHYGYDENDDNNMSNETKRETSYKHEQQVKQQHAQYAHHHSIITNNNCAMNDSITIKKTGTTRTTTSSSPYTTSTPMTTLTSTIAWRTTCIESAHIAHCSQSLLTIHIAPHGSSSERIHNHLHSILGALSLTRPLHFLLLPLPPVCPRRPPPPRAVH